MLCFYSICLLVYVFLLSFLCFYRIQCFLPHHLTNKLLIRSIKAGEKEIFFSKEGQAGSAWRCQCGASITCKRTVTAQLSAV